MLEGMAPAQARQVHAAAGGLLMYVPVVADDDFTACLAYLTRRLDENTQPENFLRALFTMVPDSPEFEREAARFRAAVENRRSVSTTRRRVRHGTRPPSLDGGRRAFGNEPDSDVTDPAVRAAFATAMARPPRPAVERITEIDAIDEVVERAARLVQPGGARPLRPTAVAARCGRRDAHRARADTVALMAHEVGKTVHEGDPEVSEAIDFCRYDATEGSDVVDAAEAAGLDVEGRGVVVVVGPWNFPYAIPTGGIAAAIAAGNNVILKPAPEAVATGAWIVEQFWRAGVPRDVLQIVVCDDGPIGTRLVTHPAVDTVVLTGSFQTATTFLDARPAMRLFAETSGKNAIDRDAVGGSRSGDRRPRPLRVRPRRTEVLGRQPRHRRRRVVRRPGVPDPAARSGAEHPCRTGDRAGDDDGSADPSAGRTPPACPDDARSGRVVAPRTRPGSTPTRRAACGRPVFVSTWRPDRGSIRPNASVPSSG